MPILLEIVGVLQRQISNLKVVIPAANDRAYATISTNYQLPTTISLVHGGAREVLRNADAAVVASGTATLEAALANCPTVLVYRVGWLFAFIARLVIKGVKHIGLANIIAEKAGRECPMPELLQENFTAENVCSRLLPWLTDGGANRSARQALVETMGLLKSEGDAIGRIARLILAQ